MSTVLVLLYIGGAYLIGSIPFGLIISRIMSGVDVRKTGSGNIGATNVLRAAGKTAAILTLFADAMKGLLPTLIAQTLFQDNLATICTGVAAVLGHNFPLYLKFKGGKGVATSYGVMLAVAPWIGLLCLIVWLASSLIWRYSSLAALISFACFPLAVFVTGLSEVKSYAFLSLFLFAMIYYRHRENIKRLLAGTEPTIGKK